MESSDKKYEVLDINEIIEKLQAFYSDLKEINIKKEVVVFKIILVNEEKQVIKEFTVHDFFDEIRKAYNENLDLGFVANLVTKKDFEIRKKLIEGLAFLVYKIFNSKFIYFYHN